MITYASDGHSAVLSDMNNTESFAALPWGAAGTPGAAWTSFLAPGIAMLAHLPAWRRAAAGCHP